MHGVSESFGGDPSFRLSAIGHILQKAAAQSVGDFERAHKEREHLPPAMVFHLTVWLSTPRRSLHTTFGLNRRERTVSAVRSFQ